ncbi:methionine/alanine import family NSS transporter small subunit [Cellulosimicrobium composti]|uniref:Methionine/alanine import family NSS transporter small subunit n=1 Tax=Cellulosimicrobium composti TaxID=2672572 RepID=A0ABX0BCK3_9MICO|nr:methionine/alanine import family NSS transporter small subunit [Cellulosimicrobium composti]NDO88683.1 methionine/alanine import family NSS transporter small subunit [Cellulosimicrobium composti]TWG84304.1 putative methionine/alanine importer small subunit [Cellulosimicrobium cellulans J34]SMF14967.1 Putative methionine and alanine importer, small subunit [Cellulosimicrobium cellulans J1]
MSAEAVTLLVLSIVVVWGGLLAAILRLRARPERTDLPSGGEDDHREDVAPVERDT